MGSLSPQRASQARRSLRRILERLQRCLDEVLDQRGPFIQGAFVEQDRRCGKPNCRCARGHPHRATVLTRSEEGKTHTYYVPVADRSRVQSRSQAYQRLRRRRAEMAALMRELLSEVDALQQALTEVYPPPDKERKKRRG